MVWLSVQDVFIYDSGETVFVWVGSNASSAEKKNGLPVAHVSILCVGQCVCVRVCVCACVRVCVCGIHMPVNKEGVCVYICTCFQE